MRQLLLIRHCQSSGQTPDAELTELGFVQAEQLAVFLADQPIDKIVSSSYVRAQQTIAPFAAATNQPVQLDERLVERTLSATRLDHWREVVRDSFADLDLRAPGGESGRAVQNRAWAALNDIFASDASLPAAIAHGNLISLVLHSLDSAFGFEQWETLSNPDVFLLQRDDRGQVHFERLWS